MQSEMGTATTCQFGSSGSPFGPPRSSCGAPGSLSETQGSPFGSSWLPFGSSRHPFCFSWIPFGYLFGSQGIVLEIFGIILWSVVVSVRRFGGHLAYDQAHWGAEGLKNEYSGSNGPECKKYWYFFDSHFPMFVLSLISFLFHVHFNYSPYLIWEKS